jgi:hypothetical protein
LVRYHDAGHASALALPEVEPLGVLRGAQVWKKNQRLAAAYRPTAGIPGRVHVFVVEGTAEHPP